MKMVNGVSRNANSTWVILRLVNNFGWLFSWHFNSRHLILTFSTLNLLAIFHVSRLSYKATWPKLVERHRYNRVSETVPVSHRTVSFTRKSKPSGISRKSEFFWSKCPPKRTFDYSILLISSTRQNDNSSKIENDNSSKIKNDNSSKWQFFHLQRPSPPSSTRVKRSLSDNDEIFLQNASAEMTKLLYMSRLIGDLESNAAADGEKSHLGHGYRAKRDTSTPVDNDIEVSHQFSPFLTISVSPSWS